MITLRKYFILSLLIVPAFMQAIPDNDGGIDGWLGRDARWHYTKQAGYGAVEGGSVTLIAALANQNGLGNLSTPAQALIAVGLSFVASNYIRNNSAKNKDGAQASHPALAWASNLGGYLALGGTVAYFLLQNAKK